MNKATKTGRNSMKRRIGVGIWEDMDGNIHWSLNELLEMVELPDTAENRAIVEAMLTKQLKRNCPGVKIIRRDKPDP